MQQDIQLIQQVLDQAIKAGLIGNLESAAAVYQAWNGIKYKLERDGHTSDTNGN